MDIKIITLSRGFPRQICTLLSQTTLTVLGNFPIISMKISCKYSFLYVSHRNAFIIKQLVVSLRSRLGSVRRKHIYWWMSYTRLVIMQCSALKEACTEQSLSISELRIQSGAHIGNYNPHYKLSLYKILKILLWIIYVFVS